MIAASSTDTRREWAQKGRTDLHFLCTAVLGNSLLTPPDDFHGEMCRFAEDRGAGPRIQLIPRGHFKSTIATIGSTIQDLIIDPNMTILIMTGKPKLAAMFLATIKRHIKHNTVLRELYPYLQPDTEERWASEEIFVERDLGIVEPSVTALSWKQSPEGGHYDRIKIDDFATLANTETRKIHAKAVEKLADVWSNVHTHDILMSGTRYTDYDCWNWALTELVAKGRMTPMVMEACDENFENILFPERFPEEKLRELKDALGERFHAQYRNEVSPEEYQKIKRSMFKYYTELPKHKKTKKPKLTYYAGADPAAGSEWTVAGASEPAIVIGGIDEDGYVYVTNVDTGPHKEGFANTGEFVDALFEWNRRLEPVIFQIESVGHAGKLLQETIQNEMIKRKEYPNFQYPPAPSQQKAVRIETILSGPYKNGAILHAPHLKGTELEDQLMRLRKARHLDRADALSYMVAVALKYGYYGERKVPLKEGYNEAEDIYSFIWRPGRKDKKGVRAF